MKVAVRIGWRDVQSEDFWGISRLDAVSLALSCVTCDDGEICTCDGEDCSAILCVRVEVSLLRMGERTVWHGDMIVRWSMGYGYGQVMGCIWMMNGKGDMAGRGGRDDGVYTLARQGRVSLINAHILIRAFSQRSCKCLKVRDSTSHPRMVA